MILQKADCPISQDPNIAYRYTTGGCLKGQVSDNVEIYRSVTVKNYFKSNQVDKINIYKYTWLQKMALLKLSEKLRQSMVNRAICVWGDFW